MKFYVIYEFDCAKEDSVNRYYPSERKLFDLTENSLEDNRKHRKLVAMLTKKQFKRFVNDTGLSPETTETMGSMTQFGWLPAVSFTYYDYYSGARASAYVTPITEKGRNDSEAILERNWERLRRAVIARFSGSSSLFDVV